MLRVGAGATALVGLPHIAGAQEATVKVGIINSVSDAPIFIADKKGFFREERVTTQFQIFGSAAQMVAPMGSGQLDVGAGGTSAGLFNAIGRGLDMRIVADKASDPPGYGFAPLLMRNELMKNGRYKTLHDLKGMTIGVSAPGSSSWPELAAVLEKANLRWGDVKAIALDYPNHIVGLQNGSIDASITIEPFATRALETVDVTRVLSSDQYYPNQEVAVLMYSGGFLRDRGLGMRFMRAYLRGVRFYNDALANGKIAGPNADEVVRILVESTPIKDANVYRKVTPNGCDPNGKVNVLSMRRDLGLYRNLGLIENKVTADETVDMSFATEAVKQLGPYRKRA